MLFNRPALSFTGVLVLAASAATAQELPQGILDCAKVSSHVARLECFDNEVARATQKSASVASAPTPSAPAVNPAADVATSQQAPAAAPEDEFGVSGRLARKREKERSDQKEAPRELTATISRIRSKPYGELVFELDNGQVWEQPEKRSSFLIKEGEHIRITQGAMGSYFLTADSGATTRVRRVR